MMNGKLRKLGYIGRMDSNNELRMMNNRWINPCDVDLYCIGKKAGKDYGHYVSEEYEYFVIRMTKPGCMGNYVTGKGGSPEDNFVAMARIEYGIANYNSAYSYIIWLMREMQARLAKGETQACFFTFRIRDPKKYSQPDSIKQITMEEFFDAKIKASSENFGDLPYLQDKAFFLHEPKPVEIRLTPGILRQMPREDKEKLTDQDLRRMDMSSSCDMANMNMLFGNLSGVTELDLSGFRTGNATTMSCMFCNCVGLRSLDLSGFDFSRVTDMYQMFEGCASIRRVMLNRSILYAGSISRDTGRIRREWYSSSSDAHSPSQADFAGTLCYADVPIKEEVPFGQLTEEEQRKHLGLNSTVEIVIV